MKPLPFASLASLLVIVAVGCGTATVEPGHRALIFAPDRGGLQHEVLQPGVYNVPGGAKLEDFDVTYARRELPLRVTTRDGKPLQAKIAVVYRPIVAELYGLESDEGPNYYEEVIAPEVLDAAREVLERSSSKEDFARTAQLDASLVSAARKKTAGKHVEIAEVVVDQMAVAP